MTETGHRMRVLAAWLVSLTMLTGFAVMLPEGAEGAPPDGTIAGNVNDGTNPLPNSMVLAMMVYSEGNIEHYTFADALGDYSIAVPGGLDYMVMVFNDTCYAESAAAHVDSSETTYLNFSLTDIAPTLTDVTLMGYVKDELGNPITSGQLAGYSNTVGGDGMPMFINLTAIDPSGFYTVDVIASPEGCGVAALSIPGYPMSDNSTEGPCESGQTYWVNLTLSTEMTTEDATVSGTVVDIDSGLPLQDVFVSVSTWNESEQRGDSNYTWTDSNGEYAMGITNGWARIMMTKPGYTMYMQDGIEISPGEDLVVNAALKVTSATVMGNVTDGSTGLPIQNARVYVSDASFTMMNMAFTNATGAYELDAFEGVDLYLVAQADGYSQSITIVSINASDVLWRDFQLRSVDAWCTGTVTDAITGDPVPDAWIEFSSSDYWESTNPDMSGAYNVSLVSGDYMVRASAPDYREETVDVTMSPGANVLDIQLTPWDIPDTARLWGYVNDSMTGTGVSGATVEVGLGAPDFGEHNMTSSMGDGYYEIMIPPVELIVLAHAFSHVHFEGTVNGSGMIDIRMDFVLDQDNWSPNVTYSQSPLENVSWSNPSHIHAVAEEIDMREMGMLQFLSNGTGSGWTYYYAVEMLYTSFNPLSNQPDNLPYWMDGDNYTVDYWWVAMPGGGWLQGSGGDLYLQYYNIWWGPDQYSAFRGMYVNSSMGAPEVGTAWFDGVTGQFEFFTFDYGGPQVTAADPTGVVSPEGMMVAVEDGTGSTMWLGSIPLGDWSVTDAEFWPDWEGPSGNYLTMMFFSDWGGGGWGNYEAMTVDNEEPIADAGPDQQVVVNTEATLDGMLSSDNVGIVSYTWTFDDGGPVMLMGAVVNYTFTTEGDHLVELVVTDGAGHSTNDTMVVEVLSDGSPTADAGPDQEVPYGTTVYFNGTGSTDDVGISNYTWTIVELSLEMYGPMPEHAFAGPGVYNVVLVVRDTEGKASAPDGMVVTATDPNPPLANAGTDQTKMGGETVTLNGSGSTDDIGVVNWTWTFDYDGTPVVLYGEVVDFTFWVEGVYVITLNVTDSAGNWATDEVQVTVSGMIPEFPALVVPVAGFMLLLLLVRSRKTRR